MTKITKLTLLFIFIFSSASFAQLSQRENLPATYKLGTRPVEGDLGFYVGVDAKTIGNLFNGSSSSGSDALRTKTDFPLVNVKYYLTNTTVLRLGVALTKEKDLFSATGAVDTTGNASVEAKSATSSHEYLLIPAIEKHFGSSNFLDAYVGAQLYLGMLRDRKDSLDVRENGDQYELKRRGGAFITGLGGFIGLQAFIADLPLAVGVEYGIVGKTYLGQKYKVQESQTVGGVVINNDHVEDPDNNAFSGYQKGSSREFTLSNMVRVTLNYYFSR
jgi:hypothetical protein